MNGPSNAPRDTRLFMTLAGVLMVALGLAASLAWPRAGWSTAPDRAHRFLGLDEPVEASARSR